MPRRRRRGHLPARCRYASQRHGHATAISLMVPKVCLPESRCLRCGGFSFVCVVVVFFLLLVFSVSVQF